MFVALGDVKSAPKLFKFSSFAIVICEFLILNDQARGIWINHSRCLAYRLILMLAYVTLEQLVLSKMVTT